MEALAEEGLVGWLYPFLLVLCLVFLNAPSILASRANFSERFAFWASFRRANNSLPPTFARFHRRTLSVFFLFVLAEALQSVYSECLYESYGFSRWAIGCIFLTAYGSALVFGTAMGTAADSLGRPKVCAICASLQFLACFLVSGSRSFPIVCLANALRGIEVSVFLSAFEAWVTTDHESRGFKQDWLSRIFWAMAFCTGAAAIIAGSVASVLVHRLDLGLTAPPALAAAVSICWLVLVRRGLAGRGWLESTRRGSSSINKVFRTRWLWEGFVGSCLSVTDKRSLLLGWPEACLEFSLCLFWFLWTPTLVADGRQIHCGIIHAYFMGSLMLGSAVAFLLLCGPDPSRLESVLPWIFATASLSLLVPAYDHQEVSVLVAAFCIYHICVGMAWPSLARLRTIYLVHDRRAATLSLYRVPMSVGVLMVFINGALAGQLHNSTIFYLCGFGLLSGAPALHHLNQLRRQGLIGEESSSVTCRYHREAADFQKRSLQF